MTERECLAVITAIEKFRPYIEGVKFTVVTDHASLQWLQNFRDTNGRVSRWALRLQAYDFNIKHRKGTQMVVPDALSRAVETVEIEYISNTVDEEYKKLRKAIRRAPQKYFDLRVDSDLIIMKHINKYADAVDDAWRVYVPSDHTELIIRENHENKLSAHGGYAKTLYRIRRRYYWPTMHRDIAKYIRKCDTCRATKPTTQNQTAPMGLYRDPERPFKMISIDFCGPYTRTRNQNRNLLVVVDSFSKFVLLKPMRSASATATVDFLEHEVFFKYGVPAVLISDNGPQLKAEVFEALLRKYKIKHWKTPNYHPQANATEAANKTIMNAVRACVRQDKDQRSWDTHLPEIACALNSSKHSATQYPPYTVLYGVDMCVSGNDHVNTERTADRLKTLNTIHQRVSENLRDAYEKSKLKYDKHTRHIEYQPGETVWKRKTTLSKAIDGYSAKLADRFEKCQIKKKVGTNSYLLTDERGKEIGVFSTQYLQAAAS